jgi:hypothetical protein
MSSSNTKKPRWGSTSAGTKQQKAKMRAVLHRNRVHRLQRQEGKAFPQKG